MHQDNIPEILFISSFPPRECGIATYSEDLILALKKAFSKSFKISVCALETPTEKHRYNDDVKYTLDTTDPLAYNETAEIINRNSRIAMVIIQHEFGFFYEQEERFRRFLFSLVKPVIIAFHTVLPSPDEKFKNNVQNLVAGTDGVIVMTENSANMLSDFYDVPKTKISVIAHGTHLVPHLDKKMLKKKYDLTNKKVLATFGLLSSNKGIETTLNALPNIVRKHEDAIFLIIGKTHPGVVKHEGEKYRESLEARVDELNLKNHVRFINKYLSLDELLEYLQMTDIYLFTSKDPNQAVSGTFSYALSCGCAIVSTPMPHAHEVLRDDAGILIESGNSQQLETAVCKLLGNKAYHRKIRLNGLHRIAPTAWENSAVKHARLFKKVAGKKIELDYNLPEFKLDHIKRMTTDFGMIQFAKLNRPDINSGYTIDDNARALIAMVQHFELTGDPEDLRYIGIYFNFIKYCMQPEGYFFNCVDADKNFTEENNQINLADANGRAIWALGYFVSRGNLFPEKLVAEAEALVHQSLNHLHGVFSTRAMAFAIKGLYFFNLEKKHPQTSSLVTAYANRLVQMYRRESDENWKWFEGYMTYANSIMPEALLYAYLETGDEVYKNIAEESFDFLLSKTFHNGNIKVISNKSWLHKSVEPEKFGEQPIDVSYTILALSRFYKVLHKEEYLQKMEKAFSWFLGNNHLHQIIYNPCTGGCYDGLEEHHVNLNQGAESTVSYLMARCTVEKHFKPLLSPGIKFNKLFYNPKNMIRTDEMRKRIS